MPKIDLERLECEPTIKVLYNSTYLTVEMVAGLA